MIVKYAPRRPLSDHNGICWGKVRYNQADAETVAAHLRRKGNNQKAYECPYCHRWHTGHPVGDDANEVVVHDR